MQKSSNWVKQPPSVLCGRGIHIHVSPDILKGRASMLWSSQHIGQQVSHTHLSRFITVAVYIHPNMYSHGRSACPCFCQCVVVALEAFGTSKCVTLTTQPSKCHSNAITVVLIITFLFFSLSQMGQQASGLLVASNQRIGSAPP